MDGYEISTHGSCVLCDRPLAGGRGDADPTIGFCAHCASELGMVPTEDLFCLSPDDIDALPFGFVTVDAEGVVEAFNAFEQQMSGLAPTRVLGRNFFRDVAPCTSVQEFEGRFRAMVERDSAGMERFRYVFRFRGGERLVQITMTYLPDRRRGILIVRAMDRA